MTDVPRPPQRKGWILHRDGRLESVPDYLLDDESIFWPPGLPLKQAGADVVFKSAQDLYRRHVVSEDEAILFLPDSTSYEEVPLEVIQKLLGGRGDATRPKEP